MTNEERKLFVLQQLEKLTIFISNKELDDDSLRYLEENLTVLIDSSFYKRTDNLPIKVRKQFGRRNEDRGVSPDIKLCKEKQLIPFKYINTTKDKVTLSDHAINADGDIVDLYTGAVLQFDYRGVVPIYNAKLMKYIYVTPNIANSIINTYIKNPSEIYISNRGRRRNKLKSTAK